MGRSIKELAIERSYTLLKEADNTTSKELANRYAFLIRKIAKKAQASLPKEIKRRICKNCGAFLKPGLTSRVRITKHKIVYYCNACKHSTRFGF